MPNVKCFKAVDEKLKKMPAEKETNTIGRKSSKPLMEKRRRARINDSLMQLKCLVLEAKNKTSKNSKLEKADILEMTVKYLKDYYRLETKGLTNEVTRSSITSQYRYGFNECISEISQFLTKADDTGCEIRFRLLNHLAVTCNSIKEPLVKRYQPISATRSTLYSQPIQDHLRRRKSQQHTRETQTHHPVLQTASASLGSPPATTMIGGFLQPVERHGPQPVGAAVTTNVARIISGIPISFTSLVTPEEVALVLPQHSLPSTGLHTHLIPVYADGTSGIPTHLTSVRLPTLCSVIQSEHGNKDVPSFVPMLPSVVLSSLDPTMLSPSFSASQRSPSSELSCSDNKPEVELSVHGAADLPILQIEDANGDRMWRPW